MKQEVNKIRLEGFYSQYNPPPRFVEKNDGSSETDINPGMSLAEMVERYVRGEEVETRHGIYNENEDEMAPQNFDLSDLSQAQNVIEDVIEKAKASKAKASKAKAGIDGAEDDNPDDTDSQADTGQRPEAAAKGGTTAKKAKAVPKSAPSSGLSDSGQGLPE